MAIEEMAELIASFGDQLRWADAAPIEPLPVSGPILVAGMGGSGISGEIAAALGRVPVHVHKAYALPPWVANYPPALVAISYSGNTEETLSVVEAGVDAGIQPAVITSGGRLSRWASEQGWPVVTVPGGLQPRAALGYMLGALLRLLGDSVQVAPGDLGAAADLVDVLTGGAGYELASDLAAGMRGRAVIVYGSTGLTAPVASRWKTQINENAKWPAWGSVLPEVDHNEIVSFTTLAELTRDRFGVIAVRDDGESERMARRFRHTADLTSDGVAWIGEVWSQGVSPLERILSLCAMGDLFSLELARIAGVDPMPVETLELLKKLLAEEIE